MSFQTQLTATGVLTFRFAAPSTLATIRAELGPSSPHASAWPTKNLSAAVDEARPDAGGEHRIDLAALPDRLGGVDEPRG